ncbi:MAG: alkaline phosphatase PhoX, partial [Planctomycetota bacterium]
DGPGEQYLRGITPAGEFYTLAKNRVPGNSELAGVCFSPDGKTLFVNIQKNGLTVAVRGRWGKGNMGK